MKKSIITLAIALMATLSYGSDGDTLTRNYKKVVKTKPSGKDTVLVVTYTITTVDTIPRVNYSKEIARFEQAYKSNQESRKIQTDEFDRLDKYYLAELKRLKAERKKTD